MSQTNMVVVEGKITRVFAGKTEKAPSRVSIRNVDDWKGNYVTRYVNWTIFPNCAGFENIKEGNTVKIVGRISENSYEKDGQKIYTTDVIANKVEVSDNVIDVPQSEAPAKTEAPATSAAPAPVSEEAISEDEIPF